jgi:hypothetical protein
LIGHQPSPFAVFLADPHNISLCRRISRYIIIFTLNREGFRKMIVEGTTARWDVELDGYFWIEPHEGAESLSPEGEALLFPRSWKRDPFKNRSYSISPMEFPNLFHILARTEPTRDGVLEFANRFGLLGLPGGWVDTGVHLPEKWIGPTAGDHGSDQATIKTLGSIRVPGEALKDWRYEIEAIALACDCWAALRGEEEQEYRELERALRDGKRDGKRIFGVHPDSHSPISDALQSLVTNHLSERISGFLRPKESGEGFDLRFKPLSLIGAIWLQLGQAIANGVWKDCRYCGTPFKPKNIKAEYCSDSHRQLAYQKRKAKKEG